MSAANDTDGASRRSGAEPDASAGRASARRLPRAFAWLLLGALVLRLALVLAPPEDLFEKGAPNQEEILRGIAAVELIDGPVAPLFDYQVNHFWGGSLVTSFLAVPVFLVFGAKLWALRLVGIGFALASVYFAFVLLDRFASRRAAWIGASLLAFAPPGYAYLTCMVFGTHLESNALALWLAWTWFEWRAHDRGGAWRTASFGVASGFALYFGYGLLVVLLLIATFEFARDKRFLFRRDMWPYAGGFLVGFAPWIAYAAHHGFRGFDVYDAGIFEHFVEGVTRGTSLDLQGLVRVSPLDKVGAMVTTDFPRALWFEGALGVDTLVVGRVLTGLLVLALMVVAWRVRGEIAAYVSGIVTRSAWKERPSLGVFALGFVALYVVAWGASDFSIGAAGFVLDYRYLMPFWPFLCVAVGIGAAACLERRGVVRVATTALVLLVPLASAGSTLARCRPAFANEAIAMPATSTKWFVRQLVVRFGEDPRRMVSVVERIETRRTGEARDGLLQWIGTGLRALGAGPEGDARERAKRVMYRRTLRTLYERASPNERAWYAPAPTR